jgi:hypothetical protein
VMARTRVPIRNLKAFPLGFRSQCRRTNPFLADATTGKRSQLYHRHLKL